MSRTPPPPLPKVVDLEYARLEEVPAWCDRLYWMLAGILGWSLVNSIATAAALLCAAVAGLIGLPDRSVGAIWAGVRPAFTICGVLLCFWLIRQSHETVSGRGIRILYLWLAALILVPLTGFQWFGHMLLARVMTPQQFGQAASLNAGASLVWTAAIPFLLVVGMIWLRRSSPR